MKAERPPLGAVKNPPTSLSVERVRLMHWAYILTYSYTYILIGEGGSGGDKDSGGFRRNAAERAGTRWNAAARHPTPGPDIGRDEMSNLRSIRAGTKSKWSWAS